MAVPASERRAVLAEFSRLASVELAGLWDNASRYSNDEFPLYITDGYPVIVDPYVEASSLMAAEWFEESDPTSPYIAVTAEPPSVEKLESNARWALTATGDKGLDNLVGSMRRTVFDGSRETTRINVERTNSRWAIDAKPSACTWCRMMATQGAVYRKRASAMASCHDNGNCVALEVRRGKYTPPAHIEKWNGEYVKAVANAGSTEPLAVQAAWRQIANQ
jgi:hypothetical protein